MRTQECSGRAVVGGLAAPLNAQSQAEKSKEETIPRGWEAAQRGQVGQTISRQALSAESFSSNDLGLSPPRYSRYRSQHRAWS
jgi:hypothetical protein